MDKKLPYDYNQLTVKKKPLEDHDHYYCYYYLLLAPCYHYYYYYFYYCCCCYSRNQKQTELIRTTV